MKCTRPRLVAQLILACGAPLLAYGQSDTLSMERKLAGLSMVWQEANYNFAFFPLSPDLDWDIEFEKAIARVMDTGSDRDYIREIQRFIALLGEAHTNVEPGRAFRATHGGVPPLELDEIERKAVVINTSRDLAADVPFGSVITHVDGRPVDEYLLEHVFPYMSASTEHYLWRSSIRGHKWRALGLLVGDVGSPLTIGFETPENDSREIVVERLPYNAEVDWQRPPRSSDSPVTFRRLRNGILYFALNTFNTPDVVTAFEQHLDELETVQAVVLDVRENAGGNSLHGWNIGKYFSDDSLEVSHWRTRAHVAAYKAWGKFSNNAERKAYFEMNAWEGPTTFSKVDPPERTFPIPVAILIGSSTYSAAEDFLAFMRAAPNVVFVGSTSAGSTGQPLSFPIPGGAWVGITSKHDRMPDGTEFVGYGVSPDVEVMQTLETFRAGADPVLERAIEVLEQRLR